MNVTMSPVFDVIVVGGGIAGSVLAGVLSRAGLGVLVVEKEPQFRDRVRGESTWPYAVSDALAMGLESLFADAGSWILQVSGITPTAKRRTPTDGLRTPSISCPRLATTIRGCRKPPFCGRNLKVQR
jgi:2-polyprenyl-6-methoxyphenol hydroxylase-like FAD-dependent oxidoreductase